MIPYTDADILVALQMEAVCDYFYAHDEHPSLMAPETIRYWIGKGKTPAQIFAIAYNTRFDAHLGATES